MSGKTDLNCADRVIEAENRSLSLFSTERSEDYMAILAAVVVIILVLAFVSN